jgi:hypothetical protein
VSEIFQLTNKKLRYRQGVALELSIAVDIYPLINKASKAIKILLIGRPAFRELCTRHIGEKLIKYVKSRSFVFPSRHNEGTQCFTHNTFIGTAFIEKSNDI